MMMVVALWKKKEKMMTHYFAAYAGLEEITKNKRFSVVVRERARACVCVSVCHFYTAISTMPTYQEFILN